MVISDYPLIGIQRKKTWFFWFSWNYEILLYGFCWNYVIENYGNDWKLLFINVDSLFLGIVTKDLHQQDPTIRKVTGKFNHQIIDNIIKECISLR